MTRTVITLSLLALGACGAPIKNDAECTIKTLCCSPVCMAIDAVVDDNGCDVVCDTANPILPEGECVAQEGACVWQ